MWFWTLCRKRNGIMYKKAWFLIDSILFLMSWKLTIRSKDVIQDIIPSFSQKSNMNLDFFGWNFVKGHLFAWSWFPRNSMKCNDIKVPKIIETQVKVLKWPWNSVPPIHLHPISFTISYLVFICWQRRTQVKGSRAEAPT